MKRSFELSSVALPEFGQPDQYPEIDASIYRRRLDDLKRGASEAGLSTIVVYADREHSANMAYLCGVDPRFEEALLVVEQSGNPVLITGPENQGYARNSRIELDIALYPPFGLLGQDRSETPPFADLLRQSGLRANVPTGVVGWKYFGPEEFESPEHVLEIPSYISDAIRSIAGEHNVFNATALLMHPSKGLRSVNEFEQIARFEYAACHVSEAVKRVIATLKPGVTERELADTMRLGRLPLSCHPMVSSGERTLFGLASPSDKVIEKGEPFQVAIGVWGGLTCRASWVAEGPDDLPSGVQDYVERLAGPYFACAVDWYETVGIGVSGGTLDALVKDHLGNPFFGVGLNPGHLIHLDEWMSSPIYPGSEEELRSGQAIQLDIIPATGTAYGTANIEDGIALLDREGREQFRAGFPAAWQRIQSRREFMTEALGIHLKPEVLPLSNLAGYFTPFLLAPSQVLVSRN